MLKTIWHFWSTKWHCDRLLRYLHPPPPHYNPWPITLATHSNAWTIFDRSNAGVVSSNPTRGMDVCVRLFCVYVVLCVNRRLVTGWSPFQGVLPTVYRLRNWKSGQGPTKGCTALREQNYNPWDVRQARQVNSISLKSGLIGRVFTSDTFLTTRHGIKKFFFYQRLRGYLVLIVQKKQPVVTLSVTHGLVL
jgi:hypothetical protein